MLKGGKGGGVVLLFRREAVLLLCSLCLVYGCELKRYLPSVLYSFAIYPQKKTIGYSCCHLCKSIRKFLFAKWRKLYQHGR
ncbi:hypothetical protein L873DRAFT_8785 [Choiromyces venosus 120613-1]|uniref:Uncharacterized protein n=1 Tax=Choiromyces venosus 120613-1 TaxID=1336337 RepID=A0A3N4K620_9PEZI|nr:hypothetical protein L873DRAFT_8785 [Choiromyces venosus 120613-1]